MEKTTLIIGHIGEDGYSVEDIETALGAAAESLQHGGTFTGKPGTRVHVTHNAVLKLQTNGAFDTSDIAQAWCKNLLTKGRMTNLYHPRKTWFVHLDHDTWRLGNITPRMEPLHTAIEEVSPETAKRWLQLVSTLYLQHAARFNERLDEGLSNFGLDQDGTIYYLDDDFYSWDHFQSFSAMLAGWFRKYADSWLDDSLTQKLGSKMSRRASRIFTGISDADPVRMIYEHLGFQFTAGEATQRLATFREALLHPEPVEDSVILESGIASTKPRMPSEMEDEKWFDDSEPVALLADVHANLPALQAVMKQLAAEGIRRLLVAGDVVGYGPHPNECIDLLQDAGAICVRGNHDHFIGSNSVPDTLHGSRKISTQWTIDELNTPRRKWLRSLALQWHAGPWLALHGAPQDPTFFNAYVYDRTAESNLHWMIDRKIRFCIHGHSHLQGVYNVRDKISSYARISGPGTLALEGYMLICPGSVGQPRCGIPGAEYAVLHPTTRRIEFRRADYDMERTIADMAAKGLPDDLIQRLRNGQ